MSTCLTSTGEGNFGFPLLSKICRYVFDISKCRRHFDHLTLQYSSKPILLPWISEIKKFRYSAQSFDSKEIAKKPKNSLRNTESFFFFLINLNLGEQEMSSVENPWSKKLLEPAVPTVHQLLKRRSEGILWILHESVKLTHRSEKKQQIIDEMDKENQRKKNSILLFHHCYSGISKRGDGRVVAEIFGGWRWNFRRSQK